MLRFRVQWVVYNDLMKGNIRPVAPLGWIDSTRGSTELVEALEVVACVSVGGRSIMSPGNPIPPVARHRLSEGGGLASQTLSYTGMPRLHGLQPSI